MSEGANPRDISGVLVNYMNVKPSIEEELYATGSTS